MTLYFLIVFGLSITTAGCFIIFAGLFRGKYATILAGFFTVAIGSIMALICFAISTPLSVLLDDVCFTSSFFFANNRYAQIILSCWNEEYYKSFVVIFVNTTRTFWISQLCPILKNITENSANSSLIPNFPEIDVSKPGMAIVDEFIIVVDSIIASIRSIDVKTLAESTVSTLEASEAFFEAIQIISTIFVTVLTCGSAFVFSYYTALTTMFCGTLIQGLGMVVWGVFASAIFLLIAGIVMISGSIFLDRSVSQTPWRLVALVFSAITFILSLVMGLVSLYGDTINAVAGFYFSNTALYLAIFVILALPSRFWPKKETSMRILWLIVAILAAGDLIFSLISIGFLASQVSVCWQRSPETCSFGCSVGTMTTRMVNLIISSISALVAIILFAIAVYRIFKPFPLKKTFSDIATDYEKHAVDLDTIRLTK